MEHPELAQLHQALIACRFNFVPEGRCSIQDLYITVKAQFAELCDDAYLCPHRGSEVHNRPEWQHVVRRSLDEMKTKAGDICHAAYGTWIFQGSQVLPPVDDAQQLPQRVSQTVVRIVR